MPDKEMKYGAWYESLMPFSFADLPIAIRVSSVAASPFPASYSYASSPVFLIQAGAKRVDVFPSE